MTVDPIHVDYNGTYITTPVVSKELAKVKIVTTIRNATNVSQAVELSSTLVDAEGNKIANIENPVKPEIISKTINIGNKIVFKRPCTTVN